MQEMIQHAVAEGPKHLNMQQVCGCIQGGGCCTAKGSAPMLAACPLEEPCAAYVSRRASNCCAAAIDVVRTLAPGSGLRYLQMSVESVTPVKWFHYTCWNPIYGS